ncbi:MAG TPA: hypothetical protein VE553_02405 [Candidatus Binatia bacterium]|nr:hypothetical protein [Candidatus Binatia bacterium]
MPRLSRYLVRLALIHLGAGFTIGALMLANKGLSFDAGLWRLRPAHIEILVVGWLIQFAMGVAFWIAPRFWEKPVRGNVAGAWLAMILLNAGVWTVAVSSCSGLPAGFVLAGRLLEGFAALSFGWHLWPRIVSREG